MQRESEVWIAVPLVLNLGSHLLTEMSLHSDPWFPLL